MIVELPSTHAWPFKNLLKWPLQLPRFSSVSIFCMIMILCLFVFHSALSHLGPHYLFSIVHFSIAPACPEGQFLRTFCAADECKVFTCIDPHKVKVCIKHGLGKMDGEEESDSNMLRVPSHFLPDSVELCLPPIVAQTLVSFGHADCGACEPV